MPPVKRPSKSPARKRVEPTDASSVAPPQPARSATEAGLTCVICMDVLINPVTLDCGHNVCLECCVDWMEKKAGPGIATMDCPVGRCTVPVKVPKVNIALRDHENSNYRERVDRRRKEERLSTMEQLQPRIASINKHLGLPTMDLGFARGIGSFVIGMVVVALMSAFLGAVTATTRAPVPALPEGVNTMNGFLHDVGLGGYASHDKDRLVGDLSGIGLVEAAALVGVSDSSQQNLLYVGMAAHGIRSVSAWTGDDVAAWSATVLPEQVAQTLPTAKGFWRFNLDGPTLLELKGEADFVALGLNTIHARKLAAELGKVLAETQSLYEWALSDWKNRHLWLWAHGQLQYAPTLSAIRVRYSLWPDVLDEQWRTNPYARCVHGQSFSEFWLSSIIFPFECQLKAVTSLGHRFGPDWVLRYVLAYLRMAHIYYLIRFIHAASPHAIRLPRGWRVPLQSLMDVTRSFLLKEVLIAAVDSMSYYPMYYLKYISFLIPSSQGQRAITNLLWLIPGVTTMYEAIACIGYWVQLSWTHRVFYLVMWSILFSNYMHSTDYTAGFGGYLVVIPSIALSWLIFCKIAQWRFN